MLILEKAGEELMRLSDTGDVTFNPFHHEYAAGGTASGQLHIREASTVRMDSAPVGGGRVARLEGRLHASAILPGTDLQFGRSASGPLAELHTSGDLFVIGADATTLADPGRAGPFTFTSVVYAAPSLDYGGTGAPAQYSDFETPTSGYETGTIDISDFANVPLSMSWPFDNTAVPLNGLLRVPSGAGPFPLALFVHGNHSASENSTPGYVYLMELLASHGILAASVDCNFLNGSNFGENDGRAIVHLQHVRQFHGWHTQAGHPLQGKVDVDRTMIVGHSRGGEGVGHASVFNRLTSVVPDSGDPPVPLDGSAGLGPYGFDLRAVVAIAPTDNQYTPVTGSSEVRDNYFIVHGSRDGDVWPFNGYQTYDRAHPIDLADPTADAEGFKALLWLIGGNHNHFNSVWFGEGSPTITRAEQENVARVYIGALAQAALLGRSGYLDLFRDCRVAWSNGWVPNMVELVGQHQDPQRLFADHYEHGVPTSPSPPVAGAVAASGGLAASEMFLNQGSSSDLYQETNAVKLDWTGAGGRYRIEPVAGGLPKGTLQYLALRCGQSDEAENTPGNDQDFTITVGDGTISHSVQASSYGTFPYPTELHNGVRRSVMQTIRIPLKEFADAGVDVTDIRTIELAFDLPQVGTATVSGSLYLDEIQVCE